MRIPFTNIEIGRTKAPEIEAVAEQPPLEAHYGSGGSMRTIYSFSYDGEKNMGELGPVKELLPDYGALRMRSWQAYLESDICQIVFKGFSRWTIGQGLKLQAEPQAETLASEKITFKLDGFNEIAESRFKVYSHSKKSSYSGMKSLHSQAKTAFINAIVGGDVLVVLRLIDGIVTTQLIDGAHLCNPTNMSYIGGYPMANGNRLKNGIEVNARGEHVAFHVRKHGGVSERIPAKVGKYGIVQAFMVYGLEYRLDDVRGIPLISAIMETAKKLDRYKEATVGSAEERQKIPYFIKHEKGTGDESPFAKQMAKASGLGNNNDLAKTIEGKQLADTVQVTFNKATVNMPEGAELASLDSKNELYFEQFFTTNINLVCATVGIPANVAMMMYDGNFSASRAALKDWEHKLGVERADFSPFYQNVYNFWLYAEILSNKIQAPGFLESMMKGNYMAIEAYQFARWVGANVPHIDPEKEVRAERLKLGELGANVPLTTAEAATEALNGGDFGANLKQYGKELKEAETEGVEKSTKQLVQVPPNGKTD